MNCGQLCRLMLVCAAFILIGVFLKDVHTTTQQRIVSLKTEVVQAVEQRDAIRAELDELKKANDVLGTEIEQLRKTNSDLLAARKASEETDAKDRRDIDALEQRIKLDAAKLEEGEKERITLSEEKHRIDQQLDASKHSLEGCNSQLSNALKQVAESELLQKQCDRVKKDYESCQADLATNEVKLSTKDSEIKAAKEELEACRAAKANKAKDIPAAANNPTAPPSKASADTANEAPKVASAVPPAALAEPKAEPKAGAASSGKSEGIADKPASEAVVKNDSIVPKADDSKLSEESAVASAAADPSAAAASNKPEGAAANSEVQQAAHADPAASGDAVASAPAAAAAA